jgi:2-dehydropantoate 2-reductase
MRILVMGAGAMGSVVGGLLAKAGHDVTLVGRAAHMEAIRRDGLRITGIWGDHHVRGL